MGKGKKIDYLYKKTGVFLKKRFWRKLKKEHKRKNIDVFFSYFYSALCTPETIYKIKSMGIITINWYCNASYQFDLVKEIAPAFDYCLVPERYRLQDYKSVGANPVYFQEAANPNIYKPYNVQKDIDVSFVGGKYGDRIDFVDYITDHKIKINVYGSGWKYRPIKDTLKKILLNKSTRFPKKSDQLFISSIISDEEYIKLYSRSKISLGFSSCGETHDGKERILQIRLRDFEGPMSGAFYMTEYQPEIEEFFEIGKELICYNSKDDLVDKIRYYLQHDKERQDIAAACLKRARNEHTWQNRFSKLFDSII